MRGTLKPYNSLRAGEVVVERCDARRRTGIIAQASARNVYGARLRNHSRHVNGIVAKVQYTV